MKYQVTFTLTEDMLGTAPLDKELYSNYIADQTTLANGQEEVETIREDKGKTGFHRDVDGNPIVYDYMIKGFLKSACGNMRRVEGSHSSKLKAFKKIIDGMVFVLPRRIPLVVNGELGELQRPLRAETPQGERVALACSETAPAGSTFTLTLMVLDDKVVDKATIEEWLGYAELMGFGQWRSGGYGRATYTIATA